MRAGSKYVRIRSSPIRIDRINRCSVRQAIAVLSSTSIISCTPPLQSLRMLPPQSSSPRSGRHISLKTSIKHMYIHLCIRHKSRDSREHQRCRCGNSRLAQNLSFCSMYAASKRIAHTFSNEDAGSRTPFSRIPTVSAFRHTNSAAWSKGPLAGAH